MRMPELRLNDAQLAAALADLGSQVAWPPVPDVRARVLSRITTARRSEWWRAFWSPRYGFAPAIVTIALARIAALMCSPEARTTATDTLRLRDVELFRGPVPTPSPTPSGSPGSIQTPLPASGLGLLVTLDEARTGARYPLVVPPDPLLGAPDAVYLRAVPGSTAVSFVYTVRAGIPSSPLAGVAAIVTEFAGGSVDEQFF